MEVLKANSPNLGQSTAEALSLYVHYSPNPARRCKQHPLVRERANAVSGCLPPQLLRETLWTFHLLFPEPGDAASQIILKREVSKNSLDRAFSRPFASQYGGHEHPQDALDPEDVRSLYQKYPYWADRLYALWKEADDPTPVTTIERWSESRRNPRFTYWCTVVSLTIAIMFGISATVLAALQVWISYCTWIDNPMKSLCS